MAFPAAPPLLVRVGDRDELVRLTRSSSVRAGLAQRARIVLLASEGMRNSEIAVRVGVTRPTVNLWRSRYVEAGLAGLVDVDRPGRPRTVDQRMIITETLRPPPVRLGVTHWSSRLLASRLKLDHVTVTKAWKAFGVQPWRAETFKFSTDPELVAKVTDVIGLYLHPPKNAIVLCVDEKSQIQALDRTQETLPMQPGHAEQRTHGYVRHGTTTLFAALEIATGKVTGLCRQRDRHRGETSPGSLNDRTQRLFQDPSEDGPGRGATARSAPARRWDLIVVRTLPRQPSVSPYPAAGSLSLSGLVTEVAQCQSCSWSALATRTFMS